MRLANGLKIPSVIGTDYIREAIKPYVAQRTREVLDPATYRFCERLHDCTDRGVIRGFRMQCNPILRTLEPMINRCLTHGEHVIVEGIHLLPSFVAQHIKRKEVFYCAIYASRKRHLENIRIASKTTRTGRPLSNYIRYFKRIRLIHDYLYADARDNNFPCYENESLGEVVNKILRDLGQSP